MSLDIDLGHDLIFKAIENDREDRLYQKWLNDSANTEIGFTEYIEMHKPYQPMSADERNDILTRFGGAN